MANEIEILRPDELVVSPIANLDAVTKSEIMMQVEFAMAHPRSITAVLKEIEELVTLNEKIAEESFYTLKRTDKDGKIKLIQGPSIRFAEVLCYCWGHVRWQKQIADVDAEFVTGEGIFMDLQRNIVGKVRTKRRITDKNGKRYNADMIQMTGNAASSLSFRNAVTGGIPQALWKEILEKAKVVAVGGTQSIAEKRTKALEYGAKIGVSAQQIFDTLGVQGINDIGVDELIALKGLFNSLKDGETNVEEAFGDPHEKELETLFDKLGFNQGRRENLRGNYRGRSVELLAYLRKQAEPLGGEKPKEEEKKPETTPQVEPEKASAPAETQQAKPRGRPKKTQAAEPVAAVTEEAKPQPQLEAKPPVEKTPEPAAASFNF